MTIQTLRLEIWPVGTTDPWPFIPVEAEPAEAVENAFDHLIRRSFDVRVLDAQHEDTSGAPREEPVEQRRARAANVQVASWRRSEADARRYHRS